MTNTQACASCWGERPPTQMVTHCHPERSWVAPMCGPCTGDMMSKFPALNFSIAPLPNYQAPVSPQFKAAADWVFAKYPKTMARLAEGAD